MSTLPEILSHLSNLQSAEADLSVELTNLLTAREPVIHSLTRLQSLVPDLNDLYGEAHLLSQTVSVTAKTADHVGGQVRSLDEEMRRVREAAERVGQVMELKVLPLVQSLASSLFIFSFVSSHVLHRYIRQWKTRTGSLQPDTVLVL